MLEVEGNVVAEIDAEALTLLAVTDAEGMLFVAVVVVEDNPDLEDVGIDVS